MATKGIVRAVKQLYQQVFKWENDGILVTPCTLPQDYFILNIIYLFPLEYVPPFLFIIEWLHLLE